MHLAHANVCLSDESCDSTRACDDYAAVDDYLADDDAAAVAVGGDDGDVDEIVFVLVPFFLVSLFVIVC